MTKRIFAGILAGILLLMLIAPAAAAAETSGTWGEGFTWSYDNHTLTISGEGDMEPGQPWAEFKDKIETVIFTGGVTKVADGAFEDYDSLETIDFGDSMREIGKRAFCDCNDIEQIRLPETFRIFGPESFRDCGMLKYIICEGGIMPSFKSGSMHTGNSISVYYPPNNPWAFEFTNTVVSAYGGKVAFYMATEDIMENGFPKTERVAEEEEETEATEATEVPTEAAEEPTEVVAAAVTETVPETTAAPVQETVPAVVETEAAVTEPVTEPVTVPTTEAPTEPETTAAETTEATELQLFTEPSEPQEEEPAKKSGGKSWMGLVMIAGVITFVVAGAMIFRSSRRRKY